MATTQTPQRQEPTDAATSEPDSHLLDLSPAVMEIRQACDELSESAHRSPFFFIVGAGISHPPVPLAASVIAHCREVATHYQRAIPPAAGQALDEYSHWFGLAYPGARQRQQYLRSLIEKKPLSLASLRLAHLLSSHKLTNLVVTTNFDDFIARALRLFGEEPAVCDHPRTVGRIDRERADIQILHVHGSYLFYDCANLRGEVTDRARPDEETSFTTVGLLDSLLWSRSPLVIGYSGWEGDVIMSALKRRLRGGNPLAQSAYWFCYRRADHARLPGWLRDSPDVRFVVPSERSAESVSAARAGVADRAGARGEERTPEPELQAFTVFDQLNRAFDIGPPALFENPIESFAKSLEAALPGSDGTAGDPYAFKALVERLYLMSKEFGRVTRTTSGLDADLERLRALMRESQYVDAVTLLAKIVPSRLAKLKEEDRREVLSACRLAGPAVFDKPRGGKRAKDLANVMVFDPALDAALGELRSGMAWVTASRPGQYGYETRLEGKSYGAFTYHLVDSLRDSDADADGDGRISLLEAAVEAGRRILTADYLQTPAVGGDAAALALFGGGKRPARPSAEGTLHALLVGVGKHRQKSMELAGPVNDVSRISKLLGTRERRLLPKAQIRTLIDKQVTRTRFNRALANLCAAGRPEDTVLFYFSGHGSHAMQGQKMFMVFWDYDGKGGGVINHDELREALALTKAGNVIVLLDF
ncbi:MAG: caspase family protein [Desulfobacterales bacterium]|nr:caspase family protein [Desulfobacterales bacterium]